MKINSKKILIFVFVIISISLVAAKVKFNKLMGNVYNINDINANIDKIKPGDTINYTGNGYSNWQVLYVDKENKTIDIVTKESVGNVTLSGQNGLDNAIEILQNEANKYADGENAISARSAAQSDLENFSFNDNFWISDVARDGVYYNTGILPFIFTDYEYLMPVVTINVDDSSNLNIGDEYSYELNGINTWYVLYKNNNTSISIIPKKMKKINTNNEKHCSNVDDAAAEKLNEYRDGSANDVRYINYDDIPALNNLISVTDYNFLRDDVTGYIFPIYVGGCNYSSSTNNQYYTMNNINLIRNEKSYNYKVLNLRTWNTPQFVTNNRYCAEYEYTLGIRPIVTIKFSDSKVEQKSLNTNLKIGDNVNYEAKGYNNWKVFSIDEAKGTVDVISGGVVKNIVYMGLEDFNNISSKLQSEADEYKNGDRVISARIVNFGDFENLVKMNDKISAKYWTDNTYVYRTKVNPNYYYNSTDRKTYSNTINSSVGIGYYNLGSAELKREWAILYTDASSAVDSNILSPATSGPYSYMAGIRPVITLKIDQVEKVDENTVTKPNDENYIAEQNDNNASKTKIIDFTQKSLNQNNNSNKNEKEIEGISKSLNDTSDNDYITENEVDNEINRLDKKFMKKVKYVLLNLLLIDLIIIFVLSKLNKKKKDKKK